MNQPHSMITFPTYLTIFRLLAIGVIALGFLVLSRPLADIIALIVFFVAAITDFFDGLIARKFKLESILGKILDPISDKILVLIAFLLIIAFYDLPNWIIIPVGIIFFRELFITGLREFLASRNLSIGVSFVAKLKTLLQMLTINVIFISGITVGGSNLGQSPLLELICIALICVSAMHTLFTGWLYFVKGIQILEKS